MQEGRMLADDDFGRLVEQLKPQMLQTVWRLLGHLHDAEDAIQDALLTIHRRWRRVERHPNPPALVLRICADAAVDRLRRQRRIRTNQPLEPSQGPAVEAKHDEQVSVEERRMAVRAALLRLSGKQRLTVIMYYFQDQSHAQIAAALGCGEATSRKHLQRALSRLTSLLGPVALDWNLGSATPGAGSQAVSQAVDQGPK
jgi:RNA polymerase sigma factor (sigma-70 family)